ncbi:MAG: endonuclease [Pseudomonadota bacterium]
MSTVTIKSVSSNRLRRRKATPPEPFFTSSRCNPGTAQTITGIAADGLEQLAQWHSDDPPDARERERNSRVEAVQGNRNPYVDLPHLVCRVFLDACPRE